MKSEFTFFQSLLCYSTLLTLPNASKIFWSWISICHIQVRKEKESFVIACMFTSFTKREIRHFHLVVVQWRQRNVQKGVMYVQSCCFALSRSAYHLYGKPGNSRENSDGRIHLGGNFPEKSITLRGITFFPFLPMRPKYLVPFVWSVPGVSCGGKWFVSTQAHSLAGVLQWYNSNSFLFSETFSSPVPFVRNFLPKFPNKW